MTDSQNAVADLTWKELATARWLHVPEILALLDPQTSPLPVRSSPPTEPPPSGTLLLYDRSATRNYKADGHEWIRKRNSPKVREDHVKLRVGGKYRVGGCYVHCASRSTLHRRAYHMLDDDDDSAGRGNGPGGASEDRGARMNQVKKGSLILLHYLDTAEAAEVSAMLADRLATSASNKKGARSRASAGGEKKKGPTRRRSKERKRPPQDAPAASSRQNAGATQQTEPPQQQYQSSAGGPVYSHEGYDRNAGGASDLPSHYNQYSAQTGQQQWPLSPGKVYDSPRSYAQEHQGFEDLAPSAASGSGNHRMVHHTGLSTASFDFDSIQPKCHRSTDSTASFDGEAIDALWNMVMDDPMGGSGSGDYHLSMDAEVSGLAEQIQQAAAQAIEQHLTANMEANLVNQMEEAMTEAATTAILQEGARNMVSDVSTLGSELGQELNITMDNMDLAMLQERIVPGLEKEVVATLDSQIPQELEERLVKTIEKQLYGGSDDASRSSDGSSPYYPPSQEYRPSPAELYTDPSRLQHGMMQAGHSMSQSNLRNEDHRYYPQTDVPDAGAHQTASSKYHEDRHVAHQNQERRTYDSHGEGYEVSQSQKLLVRPESALSTDSMDTPADRMVADAVDDSSAPTADAKPAAAPPPAEPLPNPVAPTPLPEVVDFTPADIQLGRRKKTSVVISTSASIPTLPPGNSTHTWHPVVAFVDLIPVTDAASVKGRSADTVIRNVALSPPLKTLTPYSYKCEVPTSTDIFPGCRSMILVGVYFERGGDLTASSGALSQLSAAVTLALQSVWNAALDDVASVSSAFEERGAVHIGDMARPTFLASSGGDNVQLLTQLSEEMFEFLPAPEAKPPTSAALPHPPPP